MVVAGFSIWAGGEFGRWIGIIGASLGALGALLSIPEAVGVGEEQRPVDARSRWRASCGRGAPRPGRAPGCALALDDPEPPTRPEAPFAIPRATSSWFAVTPLPSPAPARPPSSN